MRRLQGATTLGAIALLSVAACSADFALDGRACPCTDGYVCCEATDSDDVDTCLPEGATCKGKTGSVVETPEAELTGSLLATSSSDVRCFTSDADAAYWMTERGTVEAVHRASGSAVRFEDFLVPALSVGACTMARSGAYLYVTLEDAGSVLRLSVAPAAGGGVVVGAQADRLGTLGTPQALAVDGGIVYVVDHATQTLKALDATGAATDLGPVKDNAGSLAIAGADIVWSDDAGIQKRPRSGGPATVLNPDRGGSLKVRDGSVFYTYKSAVYSVPLAGGPAVARSLAQGTDLKAVQDGFFGLDDTTIVVSYGHRFYGLYESAPPRRLFTTVNGDRVLPTFIEIDAKGWLWSTTRQIRMLERSDIGSVVSPRRDEP